MSFDHPLARSSQDDHGVAASGAGETTIAELRRQLAARDKVIAVLKKRVVERDDAAITPMQVMEQNVALGKIVAMKTRELSEERQELQQALAELGQTQAMLLQAQKMESIGHLAAGVAHEINTPAQYVRDNIAFVCKAKKIMDDALEIAMQVIEQARTQGVAGELIAQFDALVAHSKFAYLRAQTPEALEQALEGLERITRIVRAMKEFSHPSAGIKEPVDLRQLVQTTVTVTRNEWKYAAELRTEFDDDLPMVSCLRDEIGQVLLNLIVNAAHAVSDTLKPGEREKGLIVVSVHAAGGAVELRVSDDGTGIPEHVRHKVFDPFFTTKGVGRGTGQGLAIVYATIVDKHDGKIFFETELGKGTTFVVRLPVQAAGG